ncbi:YacC family pilotin-like protein [Proteus mirabilis]|uniref:YacC family pilotin-like protein n=1 Tax=Proteus mirabilis TaxID=584 RepID=A0ABD5LTZ0_PROMI
MPRFFSSSAKALTYTQAEDLADLTAVYLFLNNDCGYEQISKQKNRTSADYFSQSQQWDVSNYSMLPMSKLNEDSYQDLKIYKLLITKMSTTSPKIT